MKYRKFLDLTQPENRLLHQTGEVKMEVSEYSKPEFLARCIKYGQQRSYSEAWVKHPYRAFFGIDPDETVIDEALKLDVSVDHDFANWVLEYFRWNKKNRKPLIGGTTPAQTGLWLMTQRSDEYLVEMMAYIQCRMDGGKWKKGKCV